MISLKTVFNYIKFANELTNKVSFMFNGIKKYVVRIVCVIMLLLVQFDVCAPLIDANLAMVETMEQPTCLLTTMKKAEEKKLIISSRDVHNCQTVVFYPALSTCWSIFLLFPKFRYKVTHLSVKIRGKWYIITLSFVCTAFNMSH